MGTLWSALAVISSILALVFNVINAEHLWGLLGAVFAVVAFPLMFIIVPIVLLTRGEIPLYGLLIISFVLFFWLGHKERG